VRRALRFNSLDEMADEVERLAAQPTRSLGNWSLGQALRHLAIAMNYSIDGADFKAPWHVRFVARLLRRRLLTGGLPAGIRLPAKAARVAIPGATSTEEGLHEFRCALARLKSESRRSPHLVLGRMTREQWDQFHLRHAELHLSFIEPQPELRERAVASSGVPPV
jgi:hypothetical protein